MPQCKKCQILFSTRIVIDGKERNVKNRRYCLTCSPFGHHNTVKLEERSGETIGTCGTCKRSFVYVRQKGHRCGQCNTCWTNAKRIAQKQRALNCMGGKCQACGYDRCPQALAFHHIQEETKLFNLSSSNYRSWESVAAELKKCLLLCIRCHQEYHSGFVDLSD